MHGLVNPALFAQRRNVGKRTTAVGSIVVSTLTDASANITTPNYIEWLTLDNFANGSADDHKSGSTVITGPTLTNMTRSAGPGAFTTYNWTDGTVNATSSLTGTAAYAITTGSSIGYIDFTVPASTTSHTATFLVGTYVNGYASAAQVVRFTLSDGSYAEQVVTPAQNLSAYGRVYTYYQVVYNSADNSSRTLRLRFENTPGDNTWVQYVRLVTYV